MELRSPARTEENSLTATANEVNPPLLLRAPADSSSSHPPSTGHGIRWSEGTVDNEFMGKKKSKCCCVYHRPKRWDESSSSSSSSSDSSGGEGGETSKSKADNRCVHCTEHCRGHTKHSYERKKKQRPAEPPRPDEPPCDT
ncbi:unnamed protein product [Calicophoron daubneyi]|uniref:E3 ubiquitin-protein ligase PPP1R11 n=1 Tax=Calicophoron daubneyi TaxID=300641 RepID=A0AAV2T8X5_CALDB